MIIDYFYCYYLSYSILLLSQLIDKEEGDSSNMMMKLSDVTLTTNGNSDNDRLEMDEKTTDFSMDSSCNEVMM